MCLLNAPTNASSNLYLGARRIVLVTCVLERRACLTAFLLTNRPLLPSVKVTASYEN